MKNLIEIKNLTFSFSEKKLFNDLTLNIKTSKWTTIIGLNGSGKTTLSKLINNDYKYDGDIIINSNGIILVDNKFNYDEEILVSKLIKKYYDKKIYNRVINEYGLKKITNKKVNELNNNERLMLMFCLKLSSDYSLVIIDNVLEKLNYKNKEIIINLLNKRNINIINITNSMDETLLGENIIVIDNGKVILNDTKENVFSNYTVIQKIGLDLPFIVDLSIKLKYYNLINKIYFNEEELIGAIWM